MRQTLTSFGTNSSLSNPLILQPIPQDALVLDIDDTVLYCGSNKYKDDVRLAESGLAEKLKKYKSQGIPIVFLTARDQQYREQTQQQLALLGLVYDVVLHAPSAVTELGEKVSTKGEVLREYVDSLNEADKPKYRRLLVVDDLAMNLESIEKAFPVDPSADCQVITYHYKPSIALLQRPESSPFPEDLSGFNEAKSLGGGTRSTYTIVNGEQSYVLKYGVSENSMKAEILMLELYRAMGVPVPHTQVYRKIPATLARRLGIHPATVVQISEELKSVDDAHQTDIQKSYAASFVIHALLGNIDADKYDNFLVNDAGDILLIDAGANFVYRALGQQRREDMAVVTELRTLRDSTISPNSAEWLKDLTVDDIQSQLGALLRRRDVLNKVVWEVSQAIGINPSERRKIIDGLSARFDSLVNGKKSAGVLTLRHNEIGEVEVLLSKRVRHEWYDCFGGKADAGEGFLTAACREVKEESSGVFTYTENILDKSRYCDSKTYDRFGTPQIYRMYLAFSDKGADTTVFTDNEHTEYHWVKLIDFRRAIEEKIPVLEESQQTIQVTTESGRELILLPQFNQLLQQPSCKALLDEVQKTGALSNNQKSYCASRYVSLMSTDRHMSLVARTLVERSSVLRELKRHHAYSDPTADEFGVEEYKHGAAAGGPAGFISRLKAVPTSGASAGAGGPVITAGLTPSELHLKHVLGEKYNDNNLSENIKTFVIGHYNSDVWSLSDVKKERLVTITHEMVEREREQADKIHFYHGCNDAVAFAYDVYTEFYRVLSLSDERVMLRADHPLFYRFASIDEFISHFQQKGSNKTIDNYTDGFMQTAISANPFIFGNHSTHTSHSLYYLMRNDTRASIDLEKMLLSTFEPMGIDESTIKELLQLFDESSFKGQGFLYQLALDSDVADRYAYMAGNLGVLNPLIQEGNESIKPSVVLQTLSESSGLHSEYIESLQARVMLAPKVTMHSTRVAWNADLEDKLKIDSGAIQCVAKKMVKCFMQKRAIGSALNAEEALVRQYRYRIDADGFTVEITPEYIADLLDKKSFDQLAQVIVAHPYVKTWTIRNAKARRYTSRQPYITTENCLTEASLVVMLFVCKAPDHVIKAFGPKFYEGHLHELEITRVLSLIDKDHVNDYVEEVIKDDSLLVGNTIVAAVEYGFVDILKCFLEKNAYVNAYYPGYPSLLTIAAKKGNVDVVKALLQKGAYVNANRFTYDSPLFVAAENGHIDIVKLLIENGACINENDARRKGLPQFTPHPFEMSACGSWGENRVLPLQAAVKNGHVEIVRILLYEGADVNFAYLGGTTLLYIAAQRGHIDVVNVLLAKGADVNLRYRDGSTPLYIAAQRGHIDVVNVLLAKGADVNLRYRDGSTPLYIALLHGHIDVVNVLLAKGADVNLAYQDGSTPLYIAVQNRHIDVVTALLAKGAGVNVAYNHRPFPLYIAAENGHIDMVNVLLAKGADVNLACQDGSTPLYIAIQHGHLDVVTALLAKGADVNLAYQDRMPPLYIAAQRGCASIVRAILSCAELQYSRSEFIRYAEEGGSQEIIELAEALPEVRCSSGCVMI
ncbi:MAG: ankyrin repeat domain-containing protein [Coxiellaceae bacterium]|nr:ankyrin repeat domain-containing protein [Coxiellaceae bacterium]